MNANHAVNGPSSKAVAVSVITPVFNNVDSLPELVSRLKDAMQLAGIDSWEHILVDDGSTDGSWEECERLLLQYEHLTILRLALNYGQRNAIKSGWEFSSGRLVAVLSADLQDPPELVPRLVASLDQPWGLAVGVRESREDAIWYRSASGLVNAVYARALRNFPAGGFDFYCAGSGLSHYVRTLRARRVFLQSELTRHAYKVHVVPYRRLKRPYGASQWTNRKRIHKVFWDLFDALGFPVSFFLWASVFFAGAAVLYAIRVVFTYFAGNAPFQGWTPLILLTLIFGSMTLMGLTLCISLLRRVVEGVDNRSIVVTETRGAGAKSNLLDDHD